MSTSDLIAFAALAVTVTVSIGQAVISGRVTAAKIEVATKAAEARVAELEGHFNAERAKHDAQNETLHSRINDIKDSFVRRDDFKESLGKVEKTMDAIAQAQVQLQMTLTQVLVRLGPPPN